MRNVHFLALRTGGLFLSYPCLFGDFFGQLLTRRTLAFSQFFWRIHGSAAIFGATGAWRISLAIVEEVVIDQLLAGLYVANSANPDALVLVLFGFTVWSAGVVDVHGHSIAIDYIGAIAYSEEIGVGPLVVEMVGIIVLHASAGVLHNSFPFRDAFEGEDTGGVDGGRAYDQAHGEVIVNA